MAKQNKKLSPKRESLEDTRKKQNEQITNHSNTNDIRQQQKHSCIQV